MNDDEIKGNSLPICVSVCLSMYTVPVSVFVPVRIGGDDPDDQRS